MAPWLSQSFLKLARCQNLCSMVRSSISTINSNLQKQPIFTAQWALHQTLYSFKIFHEHFLQLKRNSNKRSSNIFCLMLYKGYSNSAIEYFLDTNCITIFSSVRFQGNSQSYFCSWIFHLVKRACRCLARGTSTGGKRSKAYKRVKLSNANHLP